VSFIHKFTKDKNFLSLAGTMTNAVLGFLGFVLLTRTFEQEIFGKWVLYISSATFVEMLRFGITKVAIIRFLASADEKEEKQLQGSNWSIGLIVTAGLSLLIFIIYQVFKESLDQSAYVYFFKWYPVLAFANLPLNIALSVLQAKQRFDRILLVRLTNVGTFTAFLTVNLFFLGLKIEQVITIHILVNAITSFFYMFKGWDGIKYIRHTTKATNKKIIDFGKYSVGTLIGSNLLKSADVFIIGLSSFGAGAVALYSVPLKLTEVLEIPLRSFVATAFPRMSKASIEERKNEIKYVFYTYSGALTFMFMIIAIAGLLFAEFFVVFLGGPEYVESANIFRVFAIYGLFLPIDRFTGVALDSINQPKQNFYKVIFMTASNILGDLFMIFGLVLIYKNIEVTSVLMGVASVTIFMTIVGVVFGYRFLNKELDLEFKKIFTFGIDFFKRSYKKYLFK
jgi:O-antigen/teichoic acid export membrane protein